MAEAMIAEGSEVVIEQDGVETFRGTVKAQHPTLTIKAEIVLEPSGYQVYFWANGHHGYCSPYHATREAAEEQARALLSGMVDDLERRIGIGDGSGWRKLWQVHASESAAAELLGL